MVFFAKRSLRALFEAVTNIKENKETSLITLFTIAVSCSILGLFLLVYFNLNNILRHWSENLQVVVYLKNDAGKDNLDEIKGLIQQEAKIWKWDYLSKDDALRVFKQRLKEKSGILEGLAENPLPASFNIYFKEDFRNYDEIRLLAEKFSGMEGVEDVDYGGEWIARFEAAIFFLKVFIAAVGGLLGLGLLTIISNTIRMSVFSRYTEIEIKKLVGATRWFIEAPFLVEGIIQCLLGVLLALGFLLIFYAYFLYHLAASSQVLMGLTVVFIPGKVIFFMLLAGALMGGLGSYWALRKLIRFDQSA